MEYSITIDIAAPLDQVWAALADPATWPAWHRGLAAVTEGPGEPGTRGARRELRYELPGFTMELTETLARVSAPGRYDAIYESGGTWNLCENSLQALDDGCRWTQTNTWRFTDVDASDDDAERFAATTRLTMEDLRAYVERGETVPAAGALRR